MGVPKFYRWISERYPCLSEVVREYQIPEFDNLYLDMNGIIHACSHPNDDDIHFRISEEKIFQDIFRYIEFLFRMIKPRKVFFMAVDGVAPRAKMNQQRGRRFRSAKEAETREEEAKQRGETLPIEARFDSNCITPGTEFMVRLDRHLRYFVTNKITNDDMWRDVRVIFSGHETPGEGEHKIMDFIRHDKSSPNYDPNTRHCLYGLDADLIMLGMCSHEPHFSLLREEVKYIRNKNDKRNQRDVNPEAITFHLLHLSLFREYIDHEFSELKLKLSFPYNLENIIDDWVLMGFLVGNDFIPHIPHFHINKNSLLKLYTAYKKVILTLDGYLNENGKLNLSRFQKYLNELTEIDIDNFNDNFNDMKYFESKAGRKLFGRPLEDTSEFFELDNKASNKKFSEKLIEIDDSDSSDESEGENIDESSESEEIMEEFELYKRDYYTNKLMYSHVNRSVLKEQAHEYIRAIQWNLHYYYNGCVSWSWYYPHHYAPYISDVKNFSDIDLHFEHGEPFKPFEQLLAVLPSASKSLLPIAYQKLVSDPNSPLIDYYPENFETDQNEKQQAWEAVVLIPFIEEKRLLNAVRSYNSLLSPEEVKRNKHGPHLIYTFSTEALSPFKSPNSLVFPDIDKNHAKCVEFDLNAFRLPEERIHKGLCDGVKLDVYFPGFPTLKHIEHEAIVSKERVRVFESASLGENMILIINKSEVNQNYIEHIARQYLNRSVFVNWPHLIEGKVFQVSNEEVKYYIDKNKRIACDELNDNEYREHHSKIVSTTKHYKERWGVFTGDTDIIIHVYPLTGRKYVTGYKGNITLEKQWSKVPMLCPLQTVVKDIAVNDEAFQQFKTIEEIYSIGAKCFIIDNPYYGAMAEVIECRNTESIIKVRVFPQLEPDLDEVKERAREILNDRYLPNYVIAQRLGISSHLMSRITGTIFIKTNDQRKINIGLNLKFNARNEQIPGYSMKRDETWYFSDKVVKIMEDYLDKFPFIFEHLSSIVDKDIFELEDLIPFENKKQTAEEIQNWLRSLSYASDRRQKCNAEILDEFVVEAIEDVVNSHIVFTSEIRPIEQSYKPHQLFRSIHYLGYSLPDPKANYRLFDRVINIRSGIAVPLGAKGTIIGKHVDENKEVNTIYDIVFDEEFVGGIKLRCTSGKGYKLSPASLIDITYGLKISGNYNHFVSSRGQPLQLNSPNKSAPNRKFNNQQMQDYGPQRYATQSNPQIGQRMIRPPPAINNNTFMNTNVSMYPLNHSMNSPFQTPKYGLESSQVRHNLPQMENIWHNLTKLQLSSGNQPNTASTLPKTVTTDTVPKQILQKEKVVVKSENQSGNRDKFDNEKQTVKVNPRANNLTLFKPFKLILIEKSEQLFGRQPTFETLVPGPMRSKSAKITLPDSETFHLVMNSHPTPEEVFENLSKTALDYMNTKYRINVDLARSEKLVASPSFICDAKTSPNRPKIAASDLPRPPSMWIPKNVQTNETNAKPYIPESFVEENTKQLKEWHKKQNTSYNKDRQYQPNKERYNASNTGNQETVANASHSAGRQQNINRRFSPFSDQNESRFVYNAPNQRNRINYGQNTTTFGNQFIPLQVARNNQSQRQQAKKSPDPNLLPNPSIGKLDSTPETISLSSDDS